MQTTFSVSEDWGNGLVGFVTVENSGDQVLDNWTLTIETTFDIETIWSVDVLERVDNRYTLTPKSWNSRLAPGESTKFGFVGHHATANPHQVVVISDAVESVATPLANAAEQTTQAPIEAIDFAVTGQWGHAFVGNLSFTYNGTEPLDGWELTFEAPFPILHVWNSEIVSQNENLYTVRNSNWNKTLLPGDTITIGLKAAGSFVEPPISYLFNGEIVAETEGESVIIDLPEMPDSTLTPDSDAPKEEPISELPIDKPPIDDRPPTEGPASESPITEPSPAEEPVIDQPPVEEPVSEQPITEVPSIEDSSVEQPAAEPPAVEPNPVETEPPSESRPPMVSDENSSLYGEALQKSLLFYEAQRSGRLPNDNRIAWRGDSALSDGADVDLDLTGGYYDAGDHVKFGLPMAASLTLLSWGAIQYRQGYLQSGQYDEIKAAIKWGTDYLLKAHISDGQTTQALYAQVGDPNTDHQYWGPPETLTTERPAYKVDPANPGSDLAAETASALASASIIFRDSDPVYADELLANAKQLYTFAESYRGRYSDSIPQAQEYYNSWSGYTDELAWGAAWLYKATGEQQYLDKAQQNYRNLGVDWTHNWDDKSYGTGVLLAQITDEQLYRSEVESWLNNWVSGGINTTDGGLAWLDQWGSLRYSANTAFLAGVYSDTVNSAAGQYAQFSRQQIDYILGDNPAQQSYVAGIGNRFPKYIHHRAASGTSDINASAPNQHVLYGALVGGPRLPNDFSYVDDRNDFLGNEVALDFNAGFTGAVARLYEQDGGPLLSDAALIALSETGLSTVA